MNIIVFSPHPDDADIAMGGTIAKYVHSRHSVLMVVVTIPNQKEVREQEAKRATDILGGRLSLLRLEPSKLLFNRKLVEMFDKVIASFPPDVIYTSWIHDSHQDHAIVSEAVIAAARKNTSSLYMYHQQIPSGITPYAFKAQAFVDISEVIDIKIKAILAHESQVVKYGEDWIQGIKGEASYWGARINSKYAEAFEVVKEIKVITD